MTNSPSTKANFFDLPESEKRRLVLKAGKMAQKDMQNTTRKGFAKEITKRVFKRWVKEGVGMSEILEDELRKTIILNKYLTRKSTKARTELIKKCKLCKKPYWTIMGITICQACYIKEFPKLFSK